MALRGEHRADSSDLDPRGEAGGSPARLAHFDALTNLPNRLLFDDRLGQAIAQAKRSGEHFALHHLELDQYESVTESLGDGVGDSLLQAVVARLGVLIHNSDTFARLSGGHFAVIQRGVSSTLGVATLVQKLLELVDPGSQPAEHREGLAPFPAVRAPLGHRLVTGPVTAWPGTPPEQRPFGSGARACFR